MLPEPWPVHYARTARPRDPVVLGSLQAELQKEVAALELPSIDFRTADEIDICAMFNCWGWASGRRVEMKRRGR
jgi:hypothetical protein